MEEQESAKLVVEHGIDEVSVIALDQPKLLFGKTADADVLLDSPYISRRHAEITRDSKGYLLRDLASKNGTFVNGERLGEEGHWLKAGDRVDLARGQVVLRFESWSSTMTLPAFTPPHPGDVEVDPRPREVRVAGRLIDPPLSRKEFDVLQLLYERKGEACSKDQIAARGWPDRASGDVSDQEIEQCIRRLRLRIEPDPSRPEYILTVRGYGYKLAP